jgi:glycosyltransferase involved in cell wall biosynthesis
VASFQPEVVLACPLSPWGVATAAGAVRATGVPLVSYFMDDWAGAGERRVVNLLRSAAGWLVISDQLRDVFVERWALTAPPTLVVHNPARASSQPRRDRVARGAGGGCRIVYAGSIWPMHADALTLAADAVGLLRSRGEDCELVVHTAPDFVRRHGSLFQRSGVVDGGLRDPAQLREDLLEADLALLACSFAEEQRTMSRSSLQTKLTDYMSAGTPILGVGPDDAASIRFVEQWGVGRCCTTPDRARLADVIAELARSGELPRIAERARRVVREHFDSDEVRDRVWRFVAAASHDPRPATQPA